MRRRHAAGQARITIRSADNELAGRVDVPVAVVGDSDVVQRFADIGLDNGANLSRIPAFVEMLGREDDRGHFRRLAVDVTDGDLALGVGTKTASLIAALLASGCQDIEDAVRIIDRRRHQLCGFLAGVTEHDALVASTFVALLVGSVVNALGDIGRLRMQQHIDLGGLPVEASLLVTDFTDGLAGGSLELRRIDNRMSSGILQDVAVLVLLQQRVRHPHFTSDDHAVGGRQRFASDSDTPRVNAGFGGFAIHKINNFIGNPVTDFVWMAFCHGFTRKQVVSAHAGSPLKEKTASDVLVILPRIDKDTRT
jgi:hypothetical protein